MCRRLRNRVWTFCQWCDEVFIYPDHYYASNAVYQHTGIEQWSKPRTRPCHVQWAQPIKCVDAGSEDRCAKGTCKKCLRPEDRWLSRTARKRLGKTNGRQEGTYERHLNLWEIEQDEDDRRVFEWAKKCRRQLLQLDMISFKRLTYWTLRDLLFCVVESADPPTQVVTAMDEPQWTGTLSARSSSAAVEAQRGVSPRRAASSDFGLLTTEEQITRRLRELPHLGVPTKKGRSMVQVGD